MSYFNHAFQKTFVGVNAASPMGEGYTALNQGVLGTPGNILATGQYAFVNPKDWKVQPTIYAGTGCCNLILASGSLYANDKIGPFHGGYKESNKSKEINPKYVNKFYFAPACAPSNNVIHVGYTPYTDDQVLTITTPFSVAGTNIADTIYTDVKLGTNGSGSGFEATLTVSGGTVTAITITNAGTGYVAGDALNFLDADPVIEAELKAQLISDGGAITYPVFIIATAGAKAGCQKDFLCGETYNLRLDVKGSPALRFLNHNAYLTVSAYTGCCPEGTIVPVPVDGTIVMIEWASQIVNSPLISPFILPVVVSEDNKLWYKPGFDLTGIVAPAGYTIGGTWDNYVSAGHTVGQYAGLVLFGAYVDTKFGDCTFQVSDFYEKEPVRLYASETDLNGDPCAFSGICVVTECEGRQANGLGETVLRDVILSERYNQNFFSSDFRIREITQGNQLLSAINRSASYNRFYIQHNVPRFNNPTSTFDNDQYLLEVIVADTVTPAGGQGLLFTNFVNDWLDGCGNNCGGLVEYNCGSDCESIVPIAAPRD
jgi:hypothetical protein